MTVPTPPIPPSADAAPPGSSWPAPTAGPPGGTPPIEARARVDPFSIASLVCSLGAVWIPVIGSILGIVFGHVARRRIRRTNERGAGMALAGLIIGYVGLALTVLAIAGVVTVIAVLVGRGDEFAADSARAFERDLVVVANARGTSPRDALTVHQVLADRYYDTWDDGATLGTTGKLAAGADDEALAAAGWQLEFGGGIGGQACLTLPSSTTVQESDVREGPCRDSGPEASGT